MKSSTVFFLSLCSHALISVIAFTFIMSGSSDGTRVVPWITLFMLVLTWIIYVSIERKISFRTILLLYWISILLAWVGWGVVVNWISPFQTLLLTVIAALFWRRVWETHSDRRYLRQYLISKLTQDVILLLLLSLTATLYMQDPQLPTVVVPLIFAFFLVRIVTMMYAVRLTEQTTSTSKRGALLLIILLVFVILFLLLLDATGSTVLSLLGSGVIYALSPLLFIVGKFSEWVINVISVGADWGNYNQQPPSENEETPLSPVATADYNPIWYYSIMVILTLLVGYFLYKRVQWIRFRSFQMKDIEEERSFLTRSYRKEKKEGDRYPYSKTIGGIRKQYSAYLKQMRDKGIPRKSTETPLEYMKRVQQEAPTQNDQIDKITQSYLVARYRDDE
ncbi:DUF4129 domain-containing protein [Mechercharimyces sp. CAU 1602]|uniref:DUF4129 domain-containing protein n=1 Tax=Mechercharimyces sp. CAU 1602 TaxID=2973933 RepID=UPI002163335A|nr:DUF4129 domain-containing protein [Mechercharimyces sp. CAU 1602]MCS1351044.1 DUF4129 domain-containing protein [Mechercharimyces sp. CAU 1602]